MSKILVIEDEARTRDMFRDCLEAEGFQTLAAEDGLAGIELARQHFPNLVLCDIVMPKVDGYGVLSQLRQDVTTATIPFIFITAKIGKAERRQGMTLGADDYLTKPSTVEELLEAVSARLEKQAILQRYYSANCQPSVVSVVSTVSERETELFFPNIPELGKVFEFIEVNYNNGITLCDVAKAVGYSPAYLTNRVKLETGRTVNRWIIERRMAEALFLLRTTKQSVEQIATAVGYQNTCHFFRQFRQYQGTTPQEWRKKHRTS
ncbi:response regulator [Myxosarcina sp. GI1]|uniref:response regulator transcription factor n=1 Tax=Myxosarcina sp. GI1 TaxID=1541065 RepID=UPI0005685AA0|nr:response regulator [Myxosarcina sp. GI1]